jgi:hypothetical protein
MNTIFLKHLRNISLCTLLMLTMILANSSHAGLINPQVMLEKVANATFDRIELDK